MDIVNVHDADRQLSHLLDRVEAGEEIIIARDGRPVARLVPHEEPVGVREPGSWKGRVWIADDFDDLPEDLAAAFRGDQT